MFARLTDAVILGALLGSWSAAAQNSGPLQEAPPTSLGPSYDPFSTAAASPPLSPTKPALRPRPVAEPEPVLVRPTSPVTPPPTPFDGIWFGTFSCAAFRDKPSFTYRLIMEIRNGSWSRLNASTSTPGQPGYDHYEVGPTSADGHVMLTRTAIGDGRLPDAARVGEATSAKFVGMFRGPTFTAWGVGGRCRIHLVRQL